VEHRLTVTRSNALSIAGSIIALSPLTILSFGGDVGTLPASQRR